jgi:hypothetical protein
MQRTLQICAFVPKLHRIHETHKDVKLIMDFVPSEPLSRFIMQKAQFSEYDIRIIAS